MGGRAAVPVSRSRLLHAPLRLLEVWGAACATTRAAPRFLTSPPLAGIRGSARRRTTSARRPPLVVCAYERHHLIGPGIERAAQRSPAAVPPSRSLCRAPAPPAADTVSWAARTFLHRGQEVHLVQVLDSSAGSQAAENSGEGGILSSAGKVGGCWAAGGCWARRARAGPPRPRAPHLPWHAPLADGRWRWTRRRWRAAAPSWPSCATACWPR